ncbi:TAXI family TRAP transporter solute-binding subunit [Paracraurococcus lichenis]|uniref:TAXI family TRAP transporter solute-binding subunit n=1 Tax=Paracraurococcus lichenis TaxID=3064888 RepID=A0ABT9DUY9_9PROT|nr:TAXI family TRAP transporter solute-binding subunit [Paracraurococcus sp. LOR1-02]MDO9707610.1 TAXI family TRAP transporter solute-binding subunit [Paracraurococcus sp. LOR1-02]
MRVPIIGVGIVILLAGLAQALTPAAAQSRAGRPPSNAQTVAKINAWTLGLAGGLLEGAPVRFATEIARVVDEVDESKALRVFPVVTRGPRDNIEALLYLRGIDAAIINADALEQFRTLVPNIDQRVSYILNLFPSELHIFVRPEIQSLADLKGKKVNFNTPGTTAAYSGPLIFDRLKLEVDRTFIPHPIALEQMRRGEGGIAAVVFVTSKPVDAFLRGRWDPGFKFLPVDVTEGDFLDYYLPSVLTSKDYPQLIPEGQDVATISVPTILVAYNWPQNSDRYARLARLVDHLFDRIDQFRAPGFHPAWRDVNITAQVAGLRRFTPAQEWIDRHRVTGQQRAPAEVPQR